MPDVLCFATQGAGSGDEDRIRALLADRSPAVFPFDRARKPQMARELLAVIGRDRPRLVVMEGSGIAGGAALLAAHRRFGTRYVVSSGDAIGPFIGLRRKQLAPVGRAYERALCRNAAGFIGWTPYLTGRAITLGAPRAMTAANWPLDATPVAGRDETRRRLGIPADATVFGIVGSLNWTDPPGYCYGYDLIRALGSARRDDLRVLIVGDGSGLERLQELAAGDPRAIFTGRVDRTSVIDHMQAMDVAALPQSTDEIGALRYTTKVSEYLAAGVPVVTGQTPFAYDLGSGWTWRLPGDGPWQEPYIDALRELMETVSAADVHLHRAALPQGLAEFDPDDQRRRVALFIDDLLA